MNECRECSNKCHNKLSTHIKDKVPIELFKKNNSPILLKRCHDCRSYQFNQRIKYDLMENKEKFLYCSGKYHPLETRSTTPKELFIKNPEDPNSPLFKTCLNCRTIVTTLDKDRLDKHKESLNQNIEFLYCSHKRHPDNSRENISKELFKKDPKDPNSPLYTTCSDCRNYAIKLKECSKKYKKEIANENNIIICSRCSKEIPELQRIKNKDGTWSKLCQYCKTVEKERRLKLQLCRKNIKFEWIYQYQSCCNLCHSIFIIHPKNPDAVLEIHTYLIDNVRYLKYNNIIYKSVDFIDLHQDKFSLRILEYDHYTEKELRDLGILKCEEKYNGKKDNVSNMGSECAIRNENKFCRLLCGKCHLYETIRREKGKYIRNTLEKIKLQYVNQLKTQGCSCCSYKNNELPRFFHFDHIIPSEKIEAISVMVRECKYSYQDMLNEIAKCRILCQYCHAIHTKNQIKQGIISTR